MPNNDKIVSKRKIAVVLFNLGGPASLDEVKPFLFNLFIDKNIITLPLPIRYLLAKMISSKREDVAKDIYRQIGGKSPILELTNNQATALEKSFADDKNLEVKAFVSMRYAPPFTQDIIPKIKDFNPDEVVLLPLYPQYSTTTTKSSFQDWDRQVKKQKYDVKTHKIKSYHLEDEFINSHVDIILPFLNQAKINQYIVGKNKFNDAHKNSSKIRILFSAHGLPEKIAKKPDEIYPQQINETADAIIKKLSQKTKKNTDYPTPITDYRICYQSKVGKLEWIKPSLDEELIQAAKDNSAVIIVPIAFVSEHSETLVELDIEYFEVAKKLKIPAYYRVPALGTNQYFIKSLYNLIIQKVI